MSYSDAEKILAEFETKLSTRKRTSSPVRKFGMTRELINEITRLTADDKMKPDDKKERLIEYMLNHADEFIDKAKHGISICIFPASKLSSSISSIRICLGAS